MTLLLLMVNYPIDTYMLILLTPDSISYITVIYPYISTPNISPIYSLPSKITPNLLILIPISYTLYSLKNYPFNVYLYIYIYYSYITQYAHIYISINTLNHFKHYFMSPFRLATI